MSLSFAKLSGKTGKILKILGPDKISRRDGISYFNFAIHSEIIYDENTYKALLRFAKDFHDLTARRIAICVSTPYCPVVLKALAEKKMPHDLFNDRVRALNEFADIGYHGHFYAVEGDNVSQVSDANYNKDLVIAQIQKEINWFEGIGISPKIYVAGWWFLKPDIVLALERSGILVDVSIRKGKDNTFGTRYLRSEEVPAYGESFILPPSRSLIEIQSLFGPVMPAFLMKYHLSQFIDIKKSGDLFYIFPLHDWDIPKYRSNIISNIKELEKLKGRIGWMDILDMRDIYLDKMKR